MKYLTLCFLFILGCKETPKLKPVAINKPELIRAFRNSGNWDSVYLYSDGHLVIIQNPPEDRFFMVSYHIESNDSKETINGSLYIEFNKFPSKIEIDSLIFKNNQEKRKDYQGISIVSLFEFKDRDDYSQFLHNHK